GRLAHHHQGPGNEPHPPPVHPRGGKRRFRCLKAPGLERRVEALVPASTRIELWGMHREGAGFLMRYGLYFPGEPNCCPCATIEATLELGPDALRVRSVERVPGRADQGCPEKIRALEATDGGR